MNESKLNKNGKTDSKRITKGIKQKSLDPHPSDTVSNKKITWDDIYQNFRKGSRYLVVDSPTDPSLIDKEALVVEGKRKNCKTVKVEIDGLIYRIHHSYLRDIVSEEMRATIRQQGRPQKDSDDQGA